MAFCIHAVDDEGAVVATIGPTHRAEYGDQGLVTRQNGELEFDGLSWSHAGKPIEFTGLVIEESTTLSTADLHLIAEALDSHLYWQLSDEARRNSGYVLEPYTEEEEACMELEERVQKMIPKPTQEATS